MTAKHEVQERAATKLADGTVKSIEQARVAVRAEDPELAEREREEQRRAFREPPPKLAPPERGPMARQVETKARELMRAHPDKYPNIVAARQRAREIDPALKRREMDEEIQTATEHKKTRIARRGGEREEDVKAKLADASREVTKEGRDRQAADTAFIEQHLDAIQRRVDAGADTESAVMDEIRATVLSMFKKRVKGGSAKAASAKDFSAAEFASRVSAAMRSGVPSEKAVRQACEHFAS